MACGTRLAKGAEASEPQASATSVTGRAGLA